MDSSAFQPDPEPPEPPDLLPPRPATAGLPLLVSPLLLATPNLLATPPRLVPPLLKYPPALLASPPLKLDIVPPSPLFAVQIWHRRLGLLLTCRPLLSWNRSTPNGAFGQQWSFWSTISVFSRMLHCRPGLQSYHMNYLLYTAAPSLLVVVVGASVFAAQPISSASSASSLTRKSVMLSLLTIKPLISSRGQKISHGFELLEMVRVRYSCQSWWCILVARSPTPPEPPDPPDLIIYSLCLLVTWIFGSTVLTLSSLGDMSIVTARSATAPISFSNQGSLMLVIWNVWRLDSSPLPLYEDRFTLPLYEDHSTLPLYEDRSTLPLYEEFVTLPLYEDLGSFMEFVTLLYPLFLNSCVTRGFIKGSLNGCLYASVAILEIGNCALVAVPISGVRSSAQGVILLNNSIVQEIRGLLEDFYLFKCYVAIILLCLSTSVVVIVSFYAMMAMFVGNTYSVFGD